MYVQIPSPSRDWVLGAEVRRQSGSKEAIAGCADLKVKRAIEMSSEPRVKSKVRQSMDCHLTKSDYL